MHGLDDPKDSCARDASLKRAEVRPPEGHERKGEADRGSCSEDPIPSVECSGARNGTFAVPARTPANAAASTRDPGCACFSGRSCYSNRHPTCPCACHWTATAFGGPTAYRVALGVAGATAPNFRPTIVHFNGVERSDPVARDAPSDSASGPSSAEGRHAADS